MTHRDITNLAATEPPGCHGVTFLPYLAGERTPNWPQASGAVLGEQCFALVVAGWHGAG